jgi:hypothetical protein
MKRVKTALLFNDKYKQGYSYIMPQYTSSATNSGVIVNTVLNTQTDTQTITVTLPTGQTATATAPGNTEGVPTSVTTSIRNQFTAQGVIYNGPAVNSGISSTTTNVVNQAAVANRISTVTGDPPPDEKQPIPVSTTSNPSPIPPPATATTPEPQTNPNIDPNTNIGAEIQVAENDILQEPPDPGVDEFTGIDEQIERQQQIDDGTLEFAGIDEQIERQRQLEDGSLEFAGIDEQIAINENILEEPPVLNEEEVDSYLRQVGQQEETIESPASITESVFDPSGNNGAPQTEESVFDPTGNQGAPRGLSTSLQNTRSQATQQDVANFQAKPDWRVRLSLAPGATYLYKAATPGILAPLAATDGVIFPYTPNISVQYAANYDATDLTHSNYKFFTYRGSAVDSVTITCDFTAQDTFEANYLLAVIHFFRSVTKMFYGQDQNPKIGTPPPLCYLSGLGAFQFDAHPLAVTAFNYSLPTDVDYIRAGATPTQAGVSRAPANTPINSFSVSGSRANANGVNPGGGTAPPQFTPPAGTREATYVPTKMSISISAVPIVTRNDISNKFSLKEYATGKLLRGTQRQGGGIW